MNNNFASPAQKDYYRSVLHHFYGDDNAQSVPNPSSKENIKDISAHRLIEFINDAVAKAKQDLNQASTSSLKQLNATALPPSLYTPIPCPSGDQELAKILVFGGMLATCLVCVMIMKCLVGSRKKSAHDPVQV